MSDYLFIHSQKLRHKRPHIGLYNKFFYIIKSNNFQRKHGLITTLSFTVAFCL